MINEKNVNGSHRNRRGFLKRGLGIAGAATLGSALLTRSTPAFAQQSAPLSAGDIAILQFLAAGEALEVDFFTQYNELAGIQNSEVPGGSGNWAFQEKLTRINPNIPQYIHDNTDDEMSHQSFINA
jgi:hypothetical protein